MRWSLSGAREGQPDGMAVGWTQPIERVNIAEMQSEVIGSARFSPNGQQLVMWNAEQVGVMGVEQPKTEAVWFDYVPSLGIVYAVEWLPTADRILYIQGNDFMMPTATAVTLLDLNTMEQTVLVEDAGS